jgi:ubiquinone/menaquinone biosynthesis C-methylase UbiE
MSETPNADSIATWNEVLVPKFVRFRKVLVEGFSEHSRVALEQNPVRAGESVLDVGCGFGETSLTLAASVGASGSVLGVDCANAFLDIARSDAEAAGVTNLRFALADAQTEPFGQKFDLVFSRFGTMFFQSPVAAMKNLRGALKPGGKLLMIVWRSIENNDWVGLPKAVARKYLPPPPEDGRSCGPGPFSMADPATVEEILKKAGFSEIRLSAVDVPVMVGKDPTEATEFQLQIGPAGEIVREAGQLADAMRPAIEADLRALLDRHATKSGIRMTSSSWCVTARA